MPRASGSAARPAAAANNVSIKAGHSEPSCSTPAYQKVFRPVTRSMTRIPPVNAATPDAKERVDSRGSHRSTPDACFSIQLDASRPTITRARTPHEVTKSAWKPLAQPDVPSEELKRASPPATNPTSKRCRVTSSQAAKDSASKANRNVRSGKKNRNEECASQGDQLDGAVIPSPPKKLQSGKGSSDVVKREITTRSQGANIAAPLLMGKSGTEFGKDPASVDPLPAQQLQLKTAKKSNAITEAIASGTSQVNKSVAPAITEAISSGTSQVSQSAAPVNTDAIARGRRQANQLVAPVITEAIANRTHQVNQLAAPVIPGAIGNRTQQVNQLVAPVIPGAIDNRTQQVNQFAAPIITLPRQHLQNNNQQNLTKIPLPTSQASVPGVATGPMVVPKLEIGNADESSNPLSNPAYRRALLIKQQELLLQQYKLGNLQTQAQPHIKGPALFEDDDAPETEPLGTRCALCKLDLAFEPHGGAAHDASAPPIVAVLSCHHTFHSGCMEDVYGLAEPAQCIACLDSEAAH